MLNQVVVIQRESVSSRNKTEGNRHGEKCSLFEPYYHHHHHHQQQQRRRRRQQQLQQSRNGWLFHLISTLAVLCAGGILSSSTLSSVLSLQVVSAVTRELQQKVHVKDAISKENHGQQWSFLDIQSQRRRHQQQEEEEEEEEYVVSHNDKIQSCMDSFEYNDIDEDGILNSMEGWNFIYDMATSMTTTSPSSTTNATTEQKNKQQRGNKKKGVTACLSSVSKAFDELFVTLACICRAYGDVDTCCDIGTDNVKGKDGKDTEANHISKEVVKNNFIRLPGTRYGTVSYGTDVCLVLLNSINDICDDDGNDKFELDLSSTVHNTNSSSSSSSSNNSNNTGTKVQDIVEQVIEVHVVNNDNTTVVTDETTIPDESNQAVDADDEHNDQIHTIAEQYEDMIHSGQNMSHIEMIETILNEQPNYKNNLDASSTLSYDDDENGGGDDNDDDYDASSSSLTYNADQFERTMLPIIFGIACAFTTVLLMLRCRLRIVRKRDDLRAKRRKERKRANKQAMKVRNEQEDNNNNYGDSYDGMLNPSEAFTLPISNKRNNSNGNDDDDDDDDSMNSDDDENTGIMKDINYQQYNNRVGACEPDTVEENDPRTPFLMRSNNNNNNNHHSNSTATGGGGGGKLNDKKNKGIEIC